MSRTLPILFNTKMVKAILDGRKTVTRRVIKKEKVEEVLNSSVRKENPDIQDKRFIKCLVNSPCDPGDILYVRETWNFVYDMDDSDQTIGNTGRYIYYADDPMPFSHWVDSDTGEHKEQMPWKPSIHMPKEAARIWLKVTGVRVKRLQDMDKMDAVKEGIDTRCCVNLAHALTKFKKLWNSTIKKSDLDQYGWEANPWVWVIEFERCEKTERTLTDGRDIK